MSSVVAERVFEYWGPNGAEPALVSVFAPEPDQNDWRCNGSLAWPGYDRKQRAMGADSWQALQIAMQAVATEILVSADFKAGRIREYGRTLTDYASLTDWLGVRPIKVLED